MNSSSAGFYLHSFIFIKEHLPSSVCRNEKVSGEMVDLFGVVKQTNLQKPHVVFFEKNRCRNELPVPMIFHCFLKNIHKNCSTLDITNLAGLTPCILYTGSPFLKINVHGKPLYHIILKKASLIKM